jgi:hypothetical protein
MSCLIACSFAPVDSFVFGCSVLQPQLLSPLRPSVANLSDDSRLPLTARQFVEEQVANFGQCSERTATNPNLPQHQSSHGAYCSCFCVLLFSVLEFA